MTHDYSYHHAAPLRKHAALRAHRKEPCFFQSRLRRCYTFSHALDGRACTLAGDRGDRRWALQSTYATKAAYPVTNSHQFEERCGGARVNSTEATLGFELAADYTVMVM